MTKNVSSNNKIQLNFIIKFNNFYNTIINTITTNDGRVTVWAAAMKTQYN